MELPAEKSKICLRCGGRVLRKAKTCKYCNGELGPAESGAPRAMNTDEYLARQAAASAPTDEI